MLGKVGMLRNLAEGTAVSIRLPQIAEPKTTQDLDTWFDGRVISKSDEAALVLLNGGKFVTMENDNLVELI